MSDSTPNLRRSCRTVVPVTPFTIDVPPPVKKTKKHVAPEAPASAPALTRPSPLVHPSIVPQLIVRSPIRVVKNSVQSVSVSKAYPTIVNGVPLTTYSNRCLDAILNDPSPSNSGADDQDYKAQELGSLCAQGMEMTVKELLAKNFTHYRQRPSVTSERASEIVNRTLSENDVPQGAQLSGPPTLPPTFKVARAYQPRKPKAPLPTQTLQSALESLVASAPSAYDEESKNDAETGLDEYASHMLVSLMRSDKQIPLEPLAYPGNHLPWPVLWKQVPEYLQGDIYVTVDECVYTPMYDIMKGGVFQVPIDTPVSFVFNDRVLELTLHEMLNANGINLNSNAQHYRMLQGLFQKSGVHIRADYAERLHELQALEYGSLFLGQPDRKRSPIRLTNDKLPLMCKYAEIFMGALGRRIHGAVLVDTSGDKPPIANQTFLRTVYSQPLPLHFRRQILILFDSELPLPQIAARYGCSLRSVHETIGTRILIERHLLDQHFCEEEDSQQLLESPSGSPASATIETAKSIGDVMRPRSKIRRTHYVDLNKMVWKHFKECQAAGVTINGKHLKDQAMRYAKQMGLETFRGSEGWLDAFKRRHKIDLKTMTGFPVCYENEMYDDVEKECRDDISPTLLNHHHQYLGHHPTGSSSDDFASSFFSSLTSFPQPMVHEPSSNHLQNMINSMMTPQDPQSQQNQRHMGDDGQGDATFLNVMRSCQIKVADKDVSHALDTLRTYIVAHDPAAMSLLLPLQERLALSSSGISISSSEIPSTSSS
ncbi:unnamed protein product [Caenorhabditis sp. 36 PRJEB53466]|nr:unnamed protein product [Caenorhabditis sp. 36 PRJEB53466]